MLLFGQHRKSPTPPQKCHWDLSQSLWTEEEIEGNLIIKKLPIALNNRLALVVMNTLSPNSGPKKIGNVLILNITIDTTTNEPLLSMNTDHQIVLGDLRLALTAIAVTDHPLAECAHPRPTLLIPTHPYLEETDNEAVRQGVVQEVPR
ncbi:MAG: hypothetical protein LQ348_003190 [Seirophora lacunosa]|nr:MAG: hypothetical protein LQ348_003190 [Seirophora lacunosa]